MRQAFIGSNSQVAQGEPHRSAALINDFGNYFAITTSI
jgi:hypothetical protein